MTETLMTKIEWKNYEDVYGHHNTVKGIVRVAQGVYSPQLDNYRDISVYLPPSYYTRRDKRYPILFMQDGQNLFDAVTSYSGEWGVDEQMDKLAHKEGLEALIVGIPNMGAKRLDEYSPFVDPKLGGGEGEAYIAFIVETLKPILERDSRFLPGRQNWGIMGSSMGGLISLFGFFNRPDVFGFAGAMSPSLWFGDGQIYSFVDTAVFHPGKLYLDVGTREFGDSNWDGQNSQRTRSRKYYATVRRLKRILVRKGYRPRHDLLHIEETGARHRELAWKRRLPMALRHFIENSDWEKG